LKKRDEKKGPFLFISSFLKNPKRPLVLNSPFLSRTQHFLPNSDISVAPGEKETTRLLVPVTPKSLFAGLVANPNCALDDQRVAILCLLLGPVNELFTKPFTLMLFSHGQMAYFPLVPLDFLNLDASDNRLV